MAKKIGSVNAWLAKAGGYVLLCMMVLTICDVIGRYFFRIKEAMEKTSGETDGKTVATPPDLVVVDGGKGQLSAARAELEYLGFAEQPIIGLAKRLEEVFLPGQSEAMTIGKSAPGLILLKQIRDEAHRFAITYGRKIRSKRTIKSELDDIPGIGPSRREVLLKEFGSVANLKKQSVDDLAQVKGISRALAEKILTALERVK